MQTLLPLSEERTVDNQIQFLQFAIVDTQELARYMDKKASFVLIILGGIWSVCLNFLGDLNQVSQMQWLFLLNFGVFLLNLLYVSFLAVRCVAPIHSPSQNIDFEGLNERDQNLIQQNLFFLPALRANGKLDSSLATFILNIRNMDEEDIVKVLAFEFHKLSYLRNVKMLRFRLCYNAMYLLLFHLMAFMGVHYWLVLHP